MRRFFFLQAAACLAAVCLWTPPLYATDLDLPPEVDDALSISADWGRVLVDDSITIAKQPAHWQASGWTRLGAVALGGVLLYQYDGSLLKRFDRPNNRLLRLGANLGNPLGNPVLLLPVLGLTAYLADRQGAPELVTTAGYAAEAAIIASVAALGGKLALGRRRPDSGHGAHAFEGPGLNGDSARSLPSGHTAAAFAVAGVVAERHPKSAPIAYGVASLTAYARLARGRHWASDVFTGAALGVWIGHSVAQSHPNSSANGRRPQLAMAPLDGGLILSLNWSR